MTVVFWPVAIVLGVSSFALMMNQNLDPDYAMPWTFILVGFFEISWFMLIWRRTITWNAARKRNTWFSFPAAVILGVVLSSPVNLLAHYDRMAWWIMLGGSASLAIWPVLVVLAWRETRDEKVTTAVRCIDCGYDMRGLPECRCPECGRQYTIDQLYAAQPKQLIASSTMPRT